MKTTKIDIIEKTAEIIRSKYPGEDIEPHGSVNTNMYSDCVQLSIWNDIDSFVAKSTHMAMGTTKSRAIVEV